jgi:hypothetical protein
MLPSEIEMKQSHPFSPYPNRGRESNLQECSNKINPERNYAIDIVKGFMVEIMILYHSIEYFISPRHIVLKYIDFVTGSFVFLTGYILSNIYINKYASNVDQMYKRLMLRGLRILILFMFLNVLINSFIEKSHKNMQQFGLNHFFKNLYSIFVLGYKHHAVFEILLPIAYVLITSGLLLKFLKKTNLIIFTIIVIFLYCTLSEHITFLFLYLSIGLNGLALGYIKIETYQSTFNKKKKIISFVLVLLYFCIISIFGKDDFIYFFGILSVVSMIYIYSIDVNYSNLLYRTLIMFGQYSLISYLSQILFLQIMLKFSNILNYSIISFFAAFITTNIFVYSFCKHIIFLRNKNKYVERFYRTIFG